MVPVLILIGGKDLNKQKRHSLKIWSVRNNLCNTHIHKQIKMHVFYFLLRYVACFDKLLSHRGADVTTRSGGRGCRYNFRNKEGQREFAVGRLEACALPQIHPQLIRCLDFPLFKMGRG